MNSLCLALTATACISPMSDEPTTDDDRLLLGRNDLSVGTNGWFGQYGTGEALVTIGFPDILVSSLPTCTPSSTDSSNP